MPQWRLKIPSATCRTWHGQVNMKNKSVKDCGKWERSDKGGGGVVSRRIHPTDIYQNPHCSWHYSSQKECWSGKKKKCSFPPWSMPFNQQVDMQLQYCVISWVREEALDSCGVGGTGKRHLNSFRSGIQKGQCWDFPGSLPVVKTQCPQGVPSPVGE